MYGCVVSRFLPFPFLFVFHQRRSSVETQVADYGGMEAREGSLPGAGHEAGPLLGLDEPLVALAPRKKKTRSTAVRGIGELPHLSNDPPPKGLAGHTYSGPFKGPALHYHCRAVLTISHCVGCKLN